MTIDDSNRRDDISARGRDTRVMPGHAVIDALRDGRPYALTFAGQGAPWLDTLGEITRSHALDSHLTALTDRARGLLAPVADELLPARPAAFDPVRWLAERAEVRSDDESDAAEPSPASVADAELGSAAVSMPGVLTTQLAALRALSDWGLDIEAMPPVAVAGHSQGVLAAAATRVEPDRHADLLAFAQLLGAAATLVGRRRGLTSRAGGAPMVAVSGATPEQIREVLAGSDREHGIEISIRNGRRRVVLTGSPAELALVEARCAAVTAEQTRARDAKKRGGAVFAPVFETVTAEVGFHHPAMAEAAELALAWAERCVLRIDDAQTLAAAVLVDPVDWVASVDAVVEQGADWILDLGPGDVVGRLTRANARGTGVGTISVTTPDGRDELLRAGSAPVVPPAWSTFAPVPVTLPGGRRGVETAFTRVTGRSPILLAGMTPTTVDAPIVAAAANAGHWAELAGGGQVTEEIFTDRIAELETLLEPGRAVQFNSMFLDPYLWKLHIGGKRLVQRARAAGAPIDGVVVTAGIPELDEAVALVSELVDAGIGHVAFKPGTVAQIRSVVAIARAVGDHPVIAHIEGGRAGGHHSWEDLDDLLLATYAELRATPNLVVCVGGGIGTPERAAEYLTGTWAHAHDHPAMPVDGILVGTAAMATLEATTSPDVKRLLVETQGTPDWVGAGTALGGVASGRSQLGADIHEIDNAASRTGRLLDEVAGDADAVAERRDEIVAALDLTAKPYFGDVAEMTYEQWLRRYLELAVGIDAAAEFDCGGEFAEAITESATSRWLDVSWRERFQKMLQRTEARLHDITRGPIVTRFADAASLEQPEAAMCTLAAAFEDLGSTILHPADVGFFVELCRSPGKPVNFVPVVDADVRRWWRSDSLWQAHDARWSADQVCVIPGTVSVAGITRADEPVGELLDRFELAAYDGLVASGRTARTVFARRGSGDVARSPLVAVLSSPNVEWAGRFTQNPVHRLGDLGAWEHEDAMRGVHGPTGAVLEQADDGSVRLDVPVAPGATVSIRIEVPASVSDGGVPVVRLADAEAAMRSLSSVAAGSELPEVKRGVARTNVAWVPDLVADHTGVTAAGLVDDLHPASAGVPDVVVGACWPAVFAALGDARTPGADPVAVIEGMLDLVHLDHAVELVSPLPTETGVLVVRAEAVSVSDTEVGRVVEVHVEVGAMLGDDGLGAPILARLVERFAIRGRLGSSPAGDPVRAGGTADDTMRDTPRRTRRETTITAPMFLDAFARVSGDHNPIHTSANAARLAGLGDPIVHGMWLSAAAQHAVTAIDPAAGVPARRLTGWTARFLGMVRPGARIAVRVERVGAGEGAEIVEVQCRVDGDVVMVATGRLAAPRTVYAFPGQGIQRKGMGLDARSRSAAAREVWERADAHTREALGFSILAVVRDNPTEVTARGVTHRHPDGVLHLTQFTQVAMATLGVAQIAELREAGAFVPDALLAGHSVGEYNALAAVAGVLPLEAVLEVVFQRGSAMHELVPRDEEGRSDYRMAAIRPSQMGIDDADVADFVAGVAERTGEFLQVVNLNLRGSQYAIAGTVAGLAEFEKVADERRLAHGGKRSFILVPGIDVPFHSAVLRGGVPDFRARLDELLPERIEPEILVGRYIPNLVPEPFSLARDFVAKIADLVPSEPLSAVLADFDSYAADPVALTRIVLIELLAWQFASPVRWIETQDLLFAPESEGGLGAERFVEVGLAAVPTVANLATQTLALPGRVGGPVEVLNIEREASVVYDTDVDPAPIDDEPAEVADAAPAPAAAASAPAPAAAPASAGPRPDDIAFTAADATTTLIALWTKLRPDQIGPADTIEALCDGVSSRRNQLLVDLGSELSLGAIDGAADADMTALGATVTSLARTYRPLGPVLTDSIGDHVRKLFGPSGKRPGAIGDRVRTVWQLGDGWAQHVTAQLALGTRDGASVRGGDLATFGTSLADGAAVDAAIDDAVAAVAAARGVAVSLPSSGDAGGATIDAGALGEFTETLTGRSGVLASAARLVLEQLGHAPDTASAFGDAHTDDDLADLVAAELGSDWHRVVAPRFDAAKAVLFDDRWASAREDLALAWTGERELSHESFVGAGDALAEHAQWWRDRAEDAGLGDLAARYARIALAAQETAPGPWAGETAVVTGAGTGSIAASVVGRLLAGGATVVATTSSLGSDKLAFYRTLYRDTARAGAALWVVPANMASYADVDALTEWIGGAQYDSAGGTSTLVKPTLSPTFLFPFAAPRVAGSMADVSGRAETEMRVLLWSVERLVTGMGRLGADTAVDSTLHVVLPGSPNRGTFGGDGAYGEAKAALDAVVAKWTSESWSERITLVHASIGWVRGTGLMGGNDPLVEAVEAAGVRTWSTDEMATELLAACTAETRRDARSAPVALDLTGGLADAGLDLAALARSAAEQAERTVAAEETAEDATIAALPAPPRPQPVTAPAWADLDVEPAELVVIVGAGELGPYGSARTRFEMEVDGELSAAGVLELAWSTGLLTWEQTPKPGWYDAETGEPVAEADIWDLYHDTVVERCGIRRYEDDGAMVENTAPLLSSVFLDRDLSFVVGGEGEARAFVDADPANTSAAVDPESGEWTVTRRAGTEIRVPRKVTLSRSVGGQIPTGFDVQAWGIPADMAGSVDRVGLWNIVATVDAFLTAGFTPSELLRWVHPSLVANTQGTGMGGMTSMRSLYIDTLLGENRANDILQEALPNVIAAHVVQSYVGGYGSMVHPVAACATAAVSVEEAVDKITLGKAQFAVAGGFDDLGIEGIVGFGDMSATAKTDAMRAKGIDDRRFSRAGDRRRGGFVESQGGGTVLLARGDLALEMGLPVLGVVAYAGSFSDGVHTSIPAPGLGALGAGRGGENSGLARGLRTLGLGADDVAVVSKHDTSTAANDPNEAELHERLASALGRSTGAPLFVVSQKTLTGHAKGGAAAFQLIGLCQLLSSGVVPPNRSLDCLDEVMAENDHLVWAREPLRFGDSLPLRAGLLTSLGFGHVSGLIAVAHPEAFVAALPAERREQYRAAASRRLVDGNRRLLAAMYGGDALYERPAARRLGGDGDAAHALEAAMLVSEDARLGDDDVFDATGCR